jgi:hypothetical protein
LSSPLLSKHLKIKICKTLILSVVLKLTLALRKEHRPRVFENRVLRKVFGPKRNEVFGAWKKTV